ncbi:PD40 domain-containing protein [Novosphingobium sp. Gsoil 351]|uniref:PD40 domain-containing protein n=1 Tax=Novosphingobium sp. Gsoil 351 TaxID=2675225 RepID=UPI0018A7F7E6|nr:PD40 domain-containing protein [Novosphingobium sp. Gsoil 351]
MSAEEGSDPSLNTLFNDGCPILSPDGLSLYMATNRPEFPGDPFPDLNIWVARRETTTSGWGAPVELPAPINTSDNEYCPSPLRGKGLLFVRAPAGTNNGDIFRSRLSQDGWDTPERLPDTINSTAQEWSPSLFTDDDGNDVLYFSRTTGPAGGPHSIYASVNSRPAQLVGELSIGGDAARPNVRKDGREIVFDSGRASSLGGQDVWTSERASTSDPWSPPQHLGVVSGPGNDTRASLSWDGTFLLVGSVGKPGGEGQADIYVATRSKLKGYER